MNLKIYKNCMIWYDKEKEVLYAIPIKTNNVWDFLGIDDLTQLQGGATK